MLLKKKRLCIILPVHWSYRMGGSEYQIKCLIESNELQPLFDIFLLSRSLSIGIQSKDYTLLPIVRPHTIQRYGKLFDAPFLLKKLKEISPDVIYQNIGTAYAGIASHYARKNGCRMVLHIASDNDLMPTGNKKSIRTVIPFVEKKLLDYAIHRSDKLVAQTSLQRQLILQNYKRDVDAVVPNFQPYPEESIVKKTPIKVVWIANFKPLKQPEMFIRLADDLSKMKLDAEFLMAGAPAKSWEKDWQQTLEDKIRKVPNLSYLGARTVEEINRLLAESHIIVNTSLYEGFSNTFIQAWMRGVPVVSLNSNPDGLLSGERMGFFVSGSYEKLRQNVLQLVQDHKLRERIGLDAQVFAMEHFSIRNIKTILKIMYDD